MHSGVVNGLVRMTELWPDYKVRFVDLTVILTGVDAQFFVND